MVKAEGIAHVRARDCVQFQELKKDCNRPIRQTRPCLKAIVTQVQFTGFYPPGH